MNRLEFFGGASISTTDGPLAGRAAQRHRVALLALLASTRRASRSRDALVALLWPDADSDRGRRLLSDSVYRINHALGEVIVGVGDDLQLDRHRITSDVAELEDAVNARNWRDVAARYHGPFLDGFFLGNSVEFDHWMDAERQAYAKLAGRAFEAIAVEASQTGHFVDAADWWQRLAALFPDDSRVAIETVNALEAAGNRAGAVRHAHSHAERLRDALGVEPDRSVAELADRIAGRSVSPRRCSKCGTVVGGVDHPETLRLAGGV
jgi:DNA-binding SARP family transcriptional activator